MNHTITDTAPAYVIDDFGEIGQESLLQKITRRLVSAFKFQSRQTGTKLRTQTFVEASLLDPNLGPEIERTLR